MRVLFFLIALCITAVAGVPTQQRIIGGSLTTIDNYPFATVILNAPDQVNYNQACGGAILNMRSVLSAAHCFYNTSPYLWRIRVGSSYASSGGTVHTVSYLISHPDFYYALKQNDIGIYRIASRFDFFDNVQPGRFAGANYNLPDNTVVRTIGWGATTYGGPRSNQLRDVEIRTVNQDICQSNYNIIAMTVTENMICAGNLEQGGQDPCEGDFGGPLLHHNVVIGISSWGSGCGYRGYPAVYTRVPRYIDWLRSNA